MVQNIQTYIKLFTVLLVLAFYLLPFLSRAQSTFPQKEINQISKQALKENQQLKLNVENQTNQNPSGITNLFSLKKKFEWIRQKNFSGSKSIDTLIIGDTPNDSLIITGNYVHNGPIFILNDGLLRFKNANATILGDIYIFGTNARMYADSSYLYFPQQYFYHRALILAMNAKVEIKNTTLDYSGLSHALVAMDSSSLIMQNVHLYGFTTNGVYDHATLDINGSNQAGEYVTTDYCNLQFKHAHTILLWHQLPDTAVLNFTFPPNDTVYHYVFNDTVAGVSGINYSIKVDSCYDLMWGLMPVNGSDVTILNSEIRAIGLWFKGNYISNVSGLVDNSTYTNFTAPLSDRNLQLINSKVQTWSLYPMDTTTVNISSCILGEVGTENRSKANANGVFMDGSGGYFWASDTSLTIAGFSSFTSNIRSERNGFVIFAYSSATNGIATSLGSSVLMVIQSALPQDPIPYDASCAWFANINQPSSGFVDDSVQFIGSAWIDKTPISTLMDFNYYKMYYKKDIETNWHLFKQASYQEVHNNYLATLNTAGLTSGNYNIKLTLFDNYLDSAEAIKSINLQPLILSSPNVETRNSNLEIYPNPAAGECTVSFSIQNKSEVNIRIIDIYGKVMENIYSEKINSGVYKLKINLSKFTNNVYFVEMYDNGNRKQKKLILLH